MSEIKYRINTPTIALVFEEGRHIARSIPSGAEITVSDDTSVQENKLIEVRRVEKTVMMFAQDIRARGEKLK